MPKRLFIAVIALALLASAVYLAYFVGSVFQGESTARNLSQRYFNTPGQALTAKSVVPAIAETRRAMQRYRTPSLKLLYAELLFNQAWLDPEHCLAPLKEGLGVAQPLFLTHSSYSEFLTDRLPWVYLYAGLPTTFRAIERTVMAISPSRASDMLMYETSAFLLEDDLPGFEAMLEHEVNQRGTMLNTKALAAIGYDMLGQYAKSAEFVKAVGTSSGKLDTLQRVYFASCLADQAKFEEAGNLLRMSQDEMQPSSEMTFQLALTVAAQKGLDDPEVQKLLDESTGLNRFPSTRAEAEAALAAALYYLTRRPEYAVRLRQLRQRNPQDCGVLLAYANGAANAGEPLPSGSALPQQSAPPLADGLAAAREALRAAPGDYWKLEANMQLVRSLVREPGFVASQALQQEALQCFKRSLGDPGTTGSISVEYAPSYDSVLLDTAVRTARGAAPAFGQGMHAAVTAYLDRRAKLFSDTTDKFFK